MNIPNIKIQSLRQHTEVLQVPCNQIPCYLLTVLSIGIQHGHYMYSFIFLLFVLSVRVVYYIREKNLIGQNAANSKTKDG